MIFCSLGSGSSGNCYYFGNEKEGVLVDAGLSAKAIKNHLLSIGIHIHNIKGIVVTHSHSDHMRGLQTLTTRYNLQVYTTKTIWKYILQNNTQTRIPKESINFIAPNKKFNLWNFRVHAFNVSHDTAETLGYHLTCDNRKITVVTDLGHICDNAAKYISEANFLVIESNYDKDMLMNGPYPYFLKERISSKHGHLDNEVTANFLANNKSEDLSHVFLAHLSKDNNCPKIALSTTLTAFKEKGISSERMPQISVLERKKPSEVVCLD